MLPSLGDGSVVTWGDAAAGGDSRAVEGRLKDVHQIQATANDDEDDGAFAAILGDGSVVTWGLLPSVQQCCARSAEGRAADSSYRRCFCSHLRRWVRCDLGRSLQWWRQQCCARSAEGRAVDPIYRRCFCSHLGRWVRCDLGLCFQWWRQQSCARSAEGRPTDSSYRRCFCCYLGRWVCCHLGLCWQWWRQQICAMSVEELVTVADERYCCAGACGRIGTRLRFCPKPSNPSHALQLAARL